MPYTSKILGKTYKTKAAYKIQITKYLKHAREEYEYIKAAKKKGAKYYLGDPIGRQQQMWFTEIILIESEIKKNLIYEGEIPIVEISTKTK